MIREATELLIRAQDDETLGGLKIRVRIPEAIKDGPENDNIKIIVEGKQKAIVDHEGNFLQYEVDKSDNIAPRIILDSFQKSDGLPTRANVRVIKGGLTENKILKVKSCSDDKNYLYIEVDSNFTSEEFKKNRLPKGPVELEIDAWGKDLFTKTVDKMPFFDAVSVFGTVWSVFDMYEKALDSIGETEAKKNFDNFRNTENIRVFPYMKEKEFSILYPSDNYTKYEGNAFYDYRENDSNGKHVLLFFPIVFGGSGYTSQSSDVVSHEVGHAILNILRPDLWQSGSREINAFHETFGDMTALFTVIGFPELRQRILEKTKGNLHVDSFLSIIGEKIVDRNVGECTTLSIVPSCEEHDLSERLTKALYGTLADVFNVNRININKENYSNILENTAINIRRLFLEAAIKTNFLTFIEFGKALRTRAMHLTENTLYSACLHANFLRQGIDLTELFNSPLICILPKKTGKDKYGKDQLKPISCSTNQRKSPTYENTDSEDSTEDNLSDYFSNSSTLSSSTIISKKGFRQFY